MKTISKELEVLEVSNETKLTLNNEFSVFFEQAEEWKQKAEGLVVNDISQKEEMKQAKEARLALKRIRTSAENKRKELKEESLRTGKAIDVMANIIKFLIVPIEEDLKAKEDFEKIYNEKLAAELLEKRSSELEKYDVETSFYKLGEMPEESYDQLLENSKLAFNARIEAERKAEEDRIKKEEDDRLEQERIKKENDARIEAQRLENEKLKKEAEAREKADKEREHKNEVRNEEMRPYIKFIRDYEKMLNLSDADYKKELSEVVAGAKEHYRYEREQAAKLKAEKEKQDAILRKEREAREKIESELKAKKDAELKAIKEAEDKAKADKLARDKAEKEAELAPDKNKLENLAKEISEISLPELKSDEAKEVLRKVQVLLYKTSNYIKEQSVKL